jgi:hypothetical protein
MRSDVTRVLKRIAQRRGEPVPYSAETAHAIVIRIAEGETLKAICESSRFMPHPLTVYTWRKAHPEFETAYLNAQAIGHDMIADDCIEIADNSEGDYVERVADKETGETEFVLRPSNVARAKLRITTRLDVLERRDARYSKRQSLNHTGTLSLATLIDQSYEQPAIEGESRLVSSGDPES